MIDLMEVSNEIQESLGRNYNVPDDIDEEDLMGGKCETYHYTLATLLSSIFSFVFMIYQLLLYGFCEDVNKRHMSTKIEVCCIRSNIFWWANYEFGKFTKTFFQIDL